MVAVGTHPVSIFFNTKGLAYVLFFTDLGENEEGTPPREVPKESDTLIRESEGRFLFSRSGAGEGGRGTAPSNKKTNFHILYEYIKL
jgi:hypothetical protein